jgi:hypothetical protein
MNKNIPEFFAKRNNFDPIYIMPLSVIENYKKVLKVVKINKEPVLISGFKKFTIEQDKKDPEMLIEKKEESTTPVFQGSEK